MDDDGVPSPTALEFLLEAVNSFGIQAVNSMVLSPEDHKLTFPLAHLRRSLSPLSHSRLVYGSMSLFNGALISRCVVNAVGNPDPSFFIHGEEVDYFLRIKSKFKVATYPPSVHYHPRKRFPQRPSSEQQISRVCLAVSNRLRYISGLSPLQACVHFMFFSYVFFSSLFSMPCKGKRLLIRACLASLRNDSNFRNILIGRAYVGGMILHASP